MPSSYNDERKSDDSEDNKESSNHKNHKNQDTYEHDDAYHTPPITRKDPYERVPAAPERDVRRFDKESAQRFTSKRRLFTRKSTEYATKDMNPLQTDLFDTQRTDPRFATAVGLVRRERRMNLTDPKVIDARTKAMKHLSRQVSTKTARRSVEEQGRVIMSVNDDGIVRLAQHAGSVHLTYSGTVAFAGKRTGRMERSEGIRLETLLNVTLPVVQVADISVTINHIYNIVSEAMTSLTDRNAEEFGGHTIQMVLDNALNEALEPGLSTSLGAITNAAASNMAARMARST